MGIGIPFCFVLFLFLGFFSHLDCNSNALQKCVNIGICSKVGWEMGLHIACLLMKFGLSILYFIE
jgi:hypothetical protein